MKEGWKENKIGEVCITSSGGTPLKSKKEFYDGGNVPWLLSGEVSQGNIFKAKNFITELGLKNSSAKLFPINTILVAMYGATAGQTGILRIQAATNQAICGILPNDSFIPEFIFFFFLSKKDELISQAVGNAQPNISQLKIKNTYIPIPPLPEQKRIVEKLDKAFAAIDRAKAIAEQNLANAKELFESYLHKIFEYKKRGDKTITLKQITVKMMTGPFGSMLHKSDYVKEGIPVINPQNIVEGKIVPLQKTMIDRPTFDRLKKYALIENDIIIARRGEMGRCAVVKKENANWLCGTGSLVIRSDKNKVNPKYLSRYLSSSSIKKQLEFSSIGATMNNLNQKLLENLKLQLPSLNDQELVIQNIETLYSETMSLQNLYRKKINELAELKKSILHKAFNGEL